MRNLLMVCLMALLITWSCGTEEKESTSFFGTMGRVIRGSDGRLSMITPAAQVEFQFSGDTCSVWLSTPVAPANHQYAVLEVDGAYVERIKVDHRNPQRFSISVSEKKDWHTVRVVKATEASNGPLDFHGTTASRIRPVPVQRGLKIEFIGNSITASMGADTLSSPCGKGSKWYDQHNAWYSHAAIAGRELNAEFMLTAVSGAGIYRNWNSDGPAVPQLYGSAYLQADSTRTWDFESWHPDIVTIALGTNDMSPGDGKRPRDKFDSARFIKEYTDFVTRIAAYHPQAQIVLLTSPLKTGRQATLLLNCLQAVRMQCLERNVKTRPLMILEFREMKATGCTGHPLIPEQQEMARQVVTFLRMLKDRENRTGHGAVRHPIEPFVAPADKEHS